MVSDQQKHYAIIVTNMWQKNLKNKNTNTKYPWEIYNLLDNTINQKK